jgi:protein-tyrosine-phosphatase
MAAALLSARMPGIDVSSAGTSRLADGAQPAAEYARDEMRRRDGEMRDEAEPSRPLTTYIDRHRSRSFTADIASGVDVVVCMEQSHVDAIDQSAGRADVRVWGVPDPYVGDAETYRGCADTLAELIDRLVTELEGRG